MRAFVLSGCIGKRTRFRVSGKALISEELVRVREARWHLCETHFGCRVFLDLAVQDDQGKMIALKPVTPTNPQGWIAFQKYRRLTAIATGSRALLACAHGKK